MNCKACNLVMDDGSLLRCHVCYSSYHYKCLNIKSEQFKLFSREFRSNWICSTCTNATRRLKSNVNTPVRDHQIPTAERSLENLDMSCDNLERNNTSASTLATDFITNDKFNELLNTLNAWRNDMTADMLSIRDDIKNTLSDIRTEIKTLRIEQTALKQNISEINTEISSLQASIQFQSDSYDELRKRVDELARHTSDQTLLSASNLQLRIDSLEQQARQTNIEICNVPERRNENLINIIDAIGTAVRLPLSKGDIVSIHRVPHAQASDRPKNIIAKFSTRIQRDNILAAYRKIKTLKSDQLGINGTPSTIYLNEHLTLQKKMLFRKTRNAARELRYKYVWIKNSTILVRKEDDSPALAIRGEDDLIKLKKK